MCRPVLCYMRACVLSFTLGLTHMNDRLYTCRTLGYCTSDLYGSGRWHCRYELACTWILCLRVITYWIPCIFCAFGSILYWLWAVQMYARQKLLLLPGKMQVVWSVTHMYRYSENLCNKKCMYLNRGVTQHIIVGISTNLYLWAKVYIESQICRKGKRMFG